MTDVHVYDGNAVIYCEGALSSPNGKTAHGIIRRTTRYGVMAVVDSNHAGKDAGEVLDGRPRKIPVYAGLKEAVEAFKGTENQITHLVVGLAPDGGRLSADARNDVMKAVKMGLNVDSGLHDFLSEDDQIKGLAEAHGVKIRDIRKPKPRNELHFFSGKIEEVKSFKVAVLGTDSAIGKRTTSWILLDALKARGYTAELIGTGQTAWMQGVSHGLILDSLINDFVSGEIEHAVWSAWKENRPGVIVLEGQGSLMNPAYPGGFEILAAGRPDVIVLQHAPARRDYDGFPGYPIQPLERQIQALEIISEKPVVAITINHENLAKEEIRPICKNITEETGIQAFDVLTDGAEGVAEALEPYKSL